MKKIIFFLVFSISNIVAFAQNGNMGVGTNSPLTRLDVKGSFRTRALTPNTNGGSGNIPLSISAFKVATGNWVSPLVLPANPVPGQNMIIYSSASANTSISPANTYLTDTITMAAGEMYKFVGDGVKWTITPLAAKSASDATRFLGGTVGVKFGQASGSTANANNLAAVSPLGGIDITRGEGYTISNPSNGIFVVTFNIPFTRISGVSTNILDAYGPTGPAVAAGTAPDLTVDGVRLRTTDNTQVSQISNTQIRIKTGDDVGALNNRPFTFLVTGR